MGSDQYHLHLETLSRSKGRSSVQYAAYISGSVLKDKRCGVVHDKTSKEEVRNSTIYLPDSAPDSWKKELKECGNDKEKLRLFREKLWNSLEVVETRKNAAIGKSFDAAYPLELTEEQRKICREKTAKMFTSLGYVVDFADHMKNHNPHLQGIISVRQMVNNEQAPWAPVKEVKAYVCEGKASGHRKTFKTIKELNEYNLTPGHEPYSKIMVIDEKTGKQKRARRNEKVWLKTRVDDNPINKKQNLIKWRKEWEETINQFLPEDRKQSCLSYKTRGINKIPKRHNSQAAYKMGMKSDRIRQNMEIDRINKEIEEIEKQQKDLEPQMEEYREYQKVKDMSTEDLVHLVFSTKKQMEDDLYESLGLGKHPRNFASGLVAQKRKEEEDIRKFLEDNTEGDEGNVR